MKQPQVNCKVAPQPQSRFLSLPQEILVMIFALSNARSPAVKIITAQEWRARERERQTCLVDRSLYPKRPVPSPKVTEFLVSKQFYALAANAYACSQPVTMSEFALDPQSASNMLWIYTRHIVMGPFSFYHLRYAANIRKLSIIMRPAHFDDRAEELADRGDMDGMTEYCTDWSLNKKLTQNDFARLTGLNQWFLPVPGLRSFEIISDDLLTPLSSGQTFNWAGNLKGYECWIRDNVVVPTTTDLRADTTRMSDLASVPFTPASARTLGSALATSPPPHDLHRRPKDEFATSVNSVFDSASTSPSFTAHASPSNVADHHKTADTKTSGHDRVCGKRSSRPPVEDFLQSISKRQKITHIASTPADRQSSLSPATLDITFSEDSIASSSSPMQPAPRQTKAKRKKSKQRTLPTQITMDLASVLPQLEQLLDIKNPSLMRWLAEMKTKGKL